MKKRPTRQVCITEKTMRLLYIYFFTVENERVGEIGSFARWNDRGEMLYSFEDIWHVWLWVVSFRYPERLFGVNVAHRWQKVTCLTTQGHLSLLEWNAIDSDVQVSLVSFYMGKFSLDFGSTADGHSWLRFWDHNFMSSKVFMYLPALVTVCLSSLKFNAE